MLHIIDGYNLLFYLDFRSKTLKEARELLIDYVAQAFKDKKNVWIVFDGKQEKGLGFSRIKKGSLEIIYTIDGMSADSYIVEWFQHSKKRGQVSVYTNDKGLKRHLTEFNAKLIDLDLIEKEVKNKIDDEDKIQWVDTRYESYLLEIFNKKSKKV